MTVSATYSKLQEIVGGSSGIVSAPTALPTFLNDGELPAVITTPGPARWNEQAVGLYRQQRTYIVRVYVKPLAEGQGLDEGYQACLPVLQAVGATLLANLDLDNTVDTIQQPFNDGGVTVLEFGGTAYHGFEYRLDIIEKGT